MDRQRSALICIEFRRISANLSARTDTALHTQTRRALISLKFCFGMVVEWALESVHARLSTSRLNHSVAVRDTSIQRQPADHNLTLQKIAMTIASHRRAPPGRTLALSLAVALLATTTAALATEGQIFAIQVTPASVPVNEPVTMKLMVGGYKVKLDCAASWSVRNSFNVEVAGGQKDLIANGKDEANYSDVFKIDKPGVYSVVGQKGLAKPGQQACDGTATTTLTVMAKVSSQPLEVKPPSTTPVNRVNPIPKINPVPGNPGNPGATHKP